MKTLGGMLFLLLAVGFGVGLFVAWDLLGDYYMVISGLHLEWFSMRAFVALGAIAFAIRGVQLLRAPKAVKVEAK